MSPVQQQHIRVGSDLVATPASSTSTLPQASPDAVVAVAQSTSDSHWNRDVVAIALTLSNVPTADDPLMHTLHDLVVARGAEAFVALVGAPHALSRAALHQLLVTDFGGRALAIGVKWREEDSLQITGIVTCGPASLGQHWRLSAVFSAAHKVPLTLNVMQVAARMWFATLGRQWPRSVSWRAARGSVEGRRILETLLVFHAKKPGPRRPELWASIVATGEVHDLAPVEVRIGAGPFGSDLLDDLATWGVGTARWNVEGSPAVLREAAALSPDWSGYVLHCAELPMSCRGFQHLTPADREALLGQPIAELLNSIAVTQRAAIAKLRSLEAKLPLSSTATAAASLSASTSMDAESDAAWKSIVTTVSLSPAAKPAAAPTSMQSSICDLDEDAPWRSLFSTKSTPALSPRFAQHHDVAVLRKP